LVTVVAWVFIVISGFAALVCILQSILIAVMFPHGLMQQVSTQPGTHVREFARLMFNHIQMIFLLLLMVYAATLVTAIGLLKRENWARIVFVGLMGVGVAWNVASILLMYYFLPSTSEMLTTETLALPDQFDVMRNVVFVSGLAVSFGFIVLFGWIAGRLNSGEIRREFF
jgi:hypothetical protein